MADTITVQGDNLLVRDATGKQVYPPVSAPGPDPGPPSSGVTIAVGPTRAQKTVAAALAIAKDGDVIGVDAGTYVNDWNTITKRVVIMGVGGMAKFSATVAPPNGKGIFVTQADVTLQRLEFTGTAVSDLNGAGVRYERGNLTVDRCYFHDNQDGILAAADPNGTVKITNSEFGHNGAGDGHSHNIYVNAVKQLTVDNCWFHDCVGGNEFKSRALATTITASRFYGGSSGYNIDLPNGGVATIKNNVLQKAANAGQGTLIEFSAEATAYVGSSLVVDGNTVVNDMTQRAPRVVWNASTVTAQITGTKAYGVTASQMVTGPAQVSGTVMLSTRPTLDMSSPWS